MVRTTKLTTKFIEGFDSKGKDVTVWDESPKGFGVRFRNNRKVFIVQKRVGSGRLAKQRKMTIGTYPELSLVQARKSAYKFVANLQLGTDVVEEKAALQRAEKEQRDAQLTVANLCALWLETDALRSRMRGPRFGTLRDPKNIKQNEGQINRHINPLIGSVKINELTRKQVEKMRDDIASGKTAVDVKTGLRGRARVTGGPGTARKAVRTLSTIFNYGIREELVAVNPAAGIRLASGKSIERYLSKEEQSRLDDVLSEMEKETKYEKGCAMIRLLMLTGCRKNEIESLKWSEVDFERGFVRFSKSKTGAKVIPFSKAALRIIKEQPLLNSTPYVFPSLKINDYYKGIPKIWYEVRKRAEIEDCRLHDLRHNFASVAASNGASLPMIGALLGHTQAQTTARYAHLTNHSLMELAERVSASIDMQK